MGEAVDRETERVRRIWEKIARDYDRSMSFVERLLFAGGREWVCSQAEGDVLEIAVGTGRNLPFYPRAVRLTGVDFSPAMLEIARSRAAQAGMDVELREGDAQMLDFADASFDTVVCTLSLCSIPDDRRAVAEVKRVLRPGGRFLLMEHVRSPVLPVRFGQYVINWFSVRFQGDHMLREPLEHLRVFGFLVERLERRKLGFVELVAARKP